MQVTVEILSICQSTLKFVRVEALFPFEVASIYPWRKMREKKLAQFKKNGILKQL